MMSRNRRELLQRNRGGDVVAVILRDQQVAGGWEFARELPQMDRAAADKLYARWKKAVTKTFDWVEDDD